MQGDGIQNIEFFSLQFHIGFFLYLVDVYLNFQFILSSCGWIGSKFVVVVGLPLPRRTNPFVPVIYKYCMGSFNHFAHINSR